MKEKYIGRKRQQTWTEESAETLTCMFSEKSCLIKIYNALNKSSYPDDDKFKISIDSDVIFIRHENDVSFILDCGPIFHGCRKNKRSAVSRERFPDFSCTYGEAWPYDNRRVYGSDLIMIPAPRYVVFYAGNGQMPESRMFRISNVYENSYEKGV